MKNALIDLECMAEMSLHERHLILICNAKNDANHSKSMGVFQMNTEYYSNDEFEQVLAMFRPLGMKMDFFTYEDDFFSYVLGQQPQNLLVYNSAQSGTGPGRKSLIPSFCNLHAIPCTGSNAYVVSLCRQKYHVNQILSKAGLSVPKTWLYSFGGWLMGARPIHDLKIILKPIYESASIGIDDASVQFYTQDVDLLAQKRVELHHQSIIAQEFISGYEVEVPLVRVNERVIPLPPVGISIEGNHNLQDEILNYDRVYFDQYSFYDFQNECPELIRPLTDCAIAVVNILGMEGLCRVDFRITPHQFYITDVSTNPHFIAHSSVDFAFRKLGLSPNDIAKTILSAAMMNNAANGRLL